MSIESRNDVILSDRISAEISRLESAKQTSTLFDTSLIEKVIRNLTTDREKIVGNETVLFTGETEEEKRLKTLQAETAAIKTAEHEAEIKAVEERHSDFIQSKIFGFSDFDERDIKSYNNYLDDFDKSNGFGYLVQNRYNPNPAVQQTIARIDHTIKAGAAKICDHDHGSVAALEARCEDPAQEKGAKQALGVLLERGKLEEMGIVDNSASYHQGEVVRDALPEKLKADLQQRHGLTPEQISKMSGKQLVQLAKNDIDSRLTKAQKELGNITDPTARETAAKAFINSLPSHVLKAGIEYKILNEVQHPELANAAKKMKAYADVRLGEINSELQALPENQRLSTAKQLLKSDPELSSNAWKYEAMDKYPTIKQASKENWKETREAVIDQVSKISKELDKLPEAQKLEVATQTLKNNVPLMREAWKYGAMKDFPLIKEVSGKLWDEAQEKRETRVQELQQDLTKLPPEQRTTAAIKALQEDPKMVSAVLRSEVVGMDSELMSAAIALKEANKVKDQQYGAPVALVASNAINPEKTSATTETKPEQPTQSEAVTKAGIAATDLNKIRAVNGTSVGSPA